MMPTGECLRNLDGLGNRWRTIRANYLSSPERDKKTLLHQTEKAPRANGSLFRFDATGTHNLAASV
jgi:hypothetical protein